MQKHTHLHKLVSFHHKLLLLHSFSHITSSDSFNAMYKYIVRIKCVSVCDKAGNYGVWDSKRERKNQVLMKIVLAKSSGKICVLSTFKHWFTSECWMQILEIVMVHYVVDAVLILPYFSFHIYFSFSHLTSINIIISIHHSFFFLPQKVLPFRSAHLIWIVVFFFNFVFLLPIFF